MLKILLLAVIVVLVVLLVIIVKRKCGEEPRGMAYIQEYQIVPFSVCVNAVEVSQSLTDYAPCKITLKRGGEMESYALANEEHIRSIIAAVDSPFCIVLIDKGLQGFSRLLKFDLPARHESLSRFAVTELLNSTETKISIGDKVAGQGDAISAQNKQILAQQSAMTVTDFILKKLIDISPSGKELLVQVDIPHIEFIDNHLAIRPVEKYKRYLIDEKKLGDLYHDK